MTALMIILAVFVLIGIIPVGVDAGYINGAVSVKIKAAFVNIPVVPKKEKAPELNKKKKKSYSTENKTKKNPANLDICNIEILMEFKLGENFSHEKMTGT